MRGTLKGLIYEVADFCALVKEIYHDFGFDEIVVKFSTRPE